MRQSVAWRGALLVCALTVLGNGDPFDLVEKQKETVVLSLRDEPPMLQRIAGVLADPSQPDFGTWAFKERAGLFNAVASTPAIVSAL